MFIDTQISPRNPNLEGGVLHNFAWMSRRNFTFSMSQTEFHIPSSKSTFPTHLPISLNGNAILLVAQGRNSCDNPIISSFPYDPYATNMQVRKLVPLSRDCWPWAYLQGWPLMGIWELSFGEGFHHSLKRMTPCAIIVHANNMVFAEYLLFFWRSGTFEAAR